MRYLCLLMVFVVSSSVYLKGAEPADVEKVRQELLAKPSVEEVFPPEYAHWIKWYERHIANDNEPFTDEEVFRVFEKPASNESEKIKRLCYVEVALFRWRDRDDAILRLSDLVDLEELNTMCFSWFDSFKPFLKTRYFPAFKRALSEYLAIAGSGRVPDEQRIEACERFNFLLGMALTLDRDQTVALAGYGMRWHASDENIRRYIMSALLRDGGHPALPLVKEYFRTYCVTPYDTIAALEYLKKHVPKDELKWIIQNRCNQLQETVDILNGKETRTTERYRASHKTMEEKK